MLVSVRFDLGQWGQVVADRTTVAASISSIHRGRRGEGSGSTFGQAVVAAAATTAEAVATAAVMTAKKAAPTEAGEVVVTAAAAKAEVVGSRHELRK